MIGHARFGLSAGGRVGCGARAFRRAPNPANAAKEMEAFKQSHSVEQRQREASCMRAKHPARVPVVAELPGAGAARRMVVPLDFTAAQLTRVIRKHCAAEGTDALHGLVLWAGHGGRRGLVQSRSLLHQVDADYGDEDGLLYVALTEEPCYG